VEAQRLLWLFFSFSGRIDRRVFGLAGVFLYLIRAYPIYRMAMASNDEAAVAFWFGTFALIFGVLILSHLALCAKRLHDCGYSGWWGLFFLVADIFIFLLLCMPKGMPGPNRYGQRTNSPGTQE
jgi:uncharacterized membrane protein YhaH (DUF805 family)